MERSEPLTSLLGEAPFSFGSLEMKQEEAVLVPWH